MKKNKNTKENLILVIIASIITALSFTFENLSILMWFGFAPLIFIFIKDIKTYKSGFKYGLIFGITYYLLVLHWIFNLYPLDWIDISSGQSIIILIVGWIFISIVEGIVIGIVLGGFALIRSKNNIVNIISFAALWVIVEWVQSIGVLGFPWARIAISQTSNLTLIQSASLLGSLFIGLIIIIFNGLVALAILNKYYLRIDWKKNIVFAVMIFVLNMAYGTIKINKDNNNEDVDVVVAQGNITTAQKWESGSTKEHLDIYSELTKEGVEKSKKDGNDIKIIFWPETAVPLNLSQSNWLLNEYITIAKNNNAMLATGAFHSEVEEDVIKDYNSIYFIDSSGTTENIYFKRHLVPFGEILPYADIIYKLIPILEEANLFNGDLHAGEEAKIANSEYGKIGSVICFESIFPELILDNVRAGAELIFVATNDSWFKDSKAVYQHHSNSVLRAIETNRYVVRAANTGISSVINNKGEIINSLNPLVKGYINSKVKFISENTLYTKVGDVIVLIGVLYILLVGVNKRIRLK